MYIDPMAVKAADKNKLKAIQLDLKSKGLYTGRIDGIYGPLTARAISSYNTRVSNEQPRQTNQYNQTTMGRPVFANVPRESTGMAQFPQMQGNTNYDWAPQSMNYLNTYGLRGDSDTVGEDYIGLGRPSATTSPRGYEESGKTIMSMGSRGKEVIELQKELKKRGLYSGAIDGVYGAKTKEAVKSFQRNFNKQDNMMGSYWQDNKEVRIGNSWDRDRLAKRRVDVDGIVGDQTRAALMAKDIGPRPKTQYGPIEPMVTPYSRGYNVTDNRVMGAGDYFNAPASVALSSLMLGSALGPVVSGAGAELGAAEALVGRQAAANALNAAKAAGLYGGGMLPFPMGGTTAEIGSGDAFNGIYGNTPYRPENSYAEGGLIEKRMAESAAFSASRDRILNAYNNPGVASAAPSPAANFDFVTETPMQPDRPLTPQQPISQGQQDVNAILKLPYKERRIAHHNPGNIKYGKFASQYGAVQGRKATDGGYFAIFPDWESGMKAKKDLLTSRNYKNLTLDEAMKRWSGYYVEPKPGQQRGGYGADRIAPKLANKRMSEMNEDDLNLIMKNMARIEDGDVYKLLYQGKAMGGQIEPMSYAGGGYLDIAMAAGQQLGNLAGRVQDIANPTADPTQGDYKFNWGDALNPTKGGILLELAKKMSMDKERSNYVMGASPGNYAKGGMISRSKAREILHDGTVHGKPITEKQRRFFGYMATRKAEGGMIAGMFNPTAGPDLLNQPPTVRALLTGNTSMPMKDNSFAMGGNIGSSMNSYATGGDMKISDSSFVVDGNPSITDGNYYPQLNVKLDHGEVVKDNFVYSNKLKDPNTNITFANLAKPIEKSTGKSENYLRKFPNDPITNKTVGLNNKYLEFLKNQQEDLATSMGMRDQEAQGMAYGGMVKGYATGSQIGGPDPMYMGISNTLYFDPVSSKFKMRGVTGDYMLADYNVMAPKSVRAQYPTAQDWIRGNQGNIDSFKNQYYPTTTSTTQQKGTPIVGGFTPPKASSNLPDFIPSTVYTPKGPMPPKINPNWSMKELTPDEKQAIATAEYRNAYEQKYASDKFKTSSSWLNYLKDEETLQKIKDDKEYSNMMADFNQAYELSPEGPQTDLGFTTPNQRADMLGKMYATEDPNFMPNVQNDGMDSNLTMASKVTNPEGGRGKGFASNWTTGDYLNAATVLGRFGQLIGGPEVEKPIYDMTQISRANYDPASQLYQANRQTSAMLNRADVPSINARTALANNMLGQRLNQESQIRSQYDTMNRQALLDYENRVATQRRYNIAQDLATNQMNAQNRAAYKEAIDNAMTSLGGFGTALNQKQQGTDVLNILKTMYPDVYRRIMNGEKVNLAEEAPEAVKTETTPATKYLGGILKGYYSGGKIRKGGRYGR
jgi:peptidoglycan hydrolase-like protein with peptidoglycan-binding domain